MEDAQLPLLRARVAAVALVVVAAQTARQAAQAHRAKATTAAAGAMVLRVAAAALAVLAAAASTPGPVAAGAAVRDWQTISAQDRTLPTPVVVVVVATNLRAERLGLAVAERVAGTLVIQRQG